MVSDDGKIIAQVKSSKPRKDGRIRHTQLKRCGYDLLLLDRIKDVDRKLMILGGNRFAEQFKNYFNGLVPNGVEVYVIEKNGLRKLDI